MTSISTTWPTVVSKCFWHNIKVDVLDLIIGICYLMCGNDSLSRHPTDEPEPGRTQILEGEVQNKCK